MSICASTTTRVDVDLPDDPVDVDLADDRVDVERPDDAGRDGLDQPLTLAGGERAPSRRARAGRPRRAAAARRARRRRRRGRREAARPTRATSSPRPAPATATRRPTRVAPAAAPRTASPAAITGCRGPCGRRGVLRRRSPSAPDAGPARRRPSGRNLPRRASARPRRVAHGGWRRGLGVVSAAWTAPRSSRRSRRSAARWRTRCRTRRAARCGRWTTARWSSPRPTPSCARRCSASSTSCPPAARSTTSRAT